MKRENARWHGTLIWAGNCSASRWEDYMTLMPSFSVTDPAGMSPKDDGRVKEEEGRDEESKPELHMSALKGEVKVGVVARKPVEFGRTLTVSCVCSMHY